MGQQISGRFVQIWAKLGENFHFPGTGKDPTATGRQISGRRAFVQRRLHERRKAPTFKAGRMPEWNRLSSKIWPSVIEDDIGKEYRRGIAGHRFHNAEAL